MAVLRRLIIFLLPICFTACYEDFTPEVGTEPVLCMNSLITAGEPVEVQLTHTRLYTDSDADCTVTDATLSVFANGELQDASYIPAEGDLIRLVADSPVYGHAEAEVRVPVCVPVKHLEWKPEVKDLWTDDVPGWAMNAVVSFSVRMELTIDDPQAQDNYYRLSSQWFYHSGNYVDTEVVPDPDEEVTDKVLFSPGSLQYDAEPIFSEHIGIFDHVMGGDTTGFTFFTDRQFSGRSYTLHLHYADGSYAVNSRQYDPELLDCGLSVALHTVSESYYDWVNYQWQRDNGPLGDISDMGLGDPLRGYSNVSSGAGVVAAQSYVEYTICLDSFLKKLLGYQSL